MTTDEKPADQLAALVVNRLIKEELLRSDKRDQMITKIANGEMKETDWNLEIDLAAGKAIEK